MERWVEEIEGWDKRSVEAGYAGLRSLANASFSGAATAGGSWVFFVNGRAVGVFDNNEDANGGEVSRGDIAGFEEADLTVYEAPHPAVPLLITMQAGRTEVRGEYYTEDTPIQTVHETLQDGGFTGFLELSENVLSGDYYVVYQGGRSMEMAFIGNSRRLVTDEEAFERARDEVGIYEVVAAPIEIVEIPDAPADEAAGGPSGVAAGAGPAAGSIDDETADDNDSTPDHGSIDAPASGNPATADSSTAVEGDAGTDEGEDRESRESAPAAGADATDPTPTETSQIADSETDLPANSTTAGTASGTDDDGTNEASATDGRMSATPGEAGSGDSDAATHDSHGTGGNGDGRQTEPERDSPATAGVAGGSIVRREVPSLDPDRSGVDGTGRTTEADDARPMPAPDRAAAGDTSGELESVLEERERELEDARAELNRVRTERDELRQRVSTLETELAELQSALEDAESEDDAREAGGTDSGGVDTSLTKAEALAGTNLFVRYDSKGKTTLRDVHDGAGDAETLAANLRLEHHTEFDEETATVDDEPFASWLRGTQQFRFLRWLTTTLPFEIRDTRAVEGMAALYDALPELDRVELDGAVDVADEDGPRTLTFDVVLRDRMGDPLAVADLDASREPVSQAEMAALVTDATAVVQENDTMAGAFYVSRSYFDPAALDTAQEATSGSLLSRDSRRSFVKLSRRRGYHLCLVESRDEEFHLSVPDL